MNVVGFISQKLDLLITDISFLFVALVAYAMLRYRFMDVRVVIRRGTIYALSLLFSLAIYTYLALLLKDTIEQNWQVNPTWTAVILIALVALGFPPLKSIVEKAVNTLFKGRKSIDLAVKELQEKMTEKTDLDKIVNLISGEIRKYLEVNEVKFFIINHHNRQLVYPSEEGVDEVMERSNDLLRYFEKYREPLVRDEIGHVIEEREGEFEKDMLRQAEKELKKKKASLALPFFTEDEVFGVVFLGERPQNKAYTVEDVKYLERLREQTQFVVANAILYKEAVERVREMAAENA